jgi:hypothetical protein
MNLGLDIDFKPGRFAASLTASLATSTISYMQHWWFVPVLLFIMMLFFHSSEVIANYLACNKPDRESFDWEKQILKKAFTWLMWTCLLGMDIMRRIGVVHFEKDTAVDVPLLGGDSFFWLSSTGGALFVIGSILRIWHLADKYQGDDSDAWVVRRVAAVLRLMKGVDQERMNSAGIKTTVSRYTDGWTEDDLRSMLEFVEKRRSEPPAVITEALPHPPITG